MLKQTYQQNIEKIYKFFFYKLRDHSLAEDLTSETFLAFASKLKENEQIDNPNAYLYGIARKVWLRFLTEKYQKNALSIETIENFEKYVEELVADEEGVDLRRRILPFIRKLPKKQSIIAELRLVHGLEVKEIAQKIKKDRNYVKTTLKRALKNLKKTIELEKELA